MGSKRKRSDAAFKANVALEALQGERTISGIATLARGDTRKIKPIAVRIYLG